MHWVSTKRPTEYQTTRVGSVSWIILDDFAIEYRKIHLVKREPISLNLLIGMVSNPDSIRAYCFNDF